MTRKILVLFIIILSSNLYSQSLDLLYKKIENKIKEDKTYLNLYSVEFYPVKSSDVSGLQNIPKAGGGNVNFEANSTLNQKYLFIVMPRNMDFDSTNILIIKKQITPQSIGINVLQGANNASQQGGASRTREQEFLTFKDIQNLYYNYPAIYHRLWKLSDSLMSVSKPQKLLKIKVQNEIKKSKGISAKDNLDYLNFKKVNSYDYYPSQDTSHLAANTMSGRFASKASKNGLHISADFSRLTFFYADYMQWDYNLVSLSLSTQSELMNISPYEGMILCPGFRTLVFLGNKGDFQNNFIVDATISGRFRLNTRHLIDHLPFIFANSPKLNIGSGVNINLSLTRPLGLPFLNFYFGTGSQDVSKPYVKFGNADTSVAYFNFQQFSATMSFYWNSSESRNLRFRMDVGLGRYNIVKALYLNNETQSSLTYNKFSPLIKLYLTFVPSGNDLFGTSMRLFDSRIKMNFWLQLFKINSHIVRIIASHITNPFFRSLKPWETSSSTIFGVNYRYGF